MLLCSESSPPPYWWSSEESTEILENLSIELKILIVSRLAYVKENWIHEHGRLEIEELDTSSLAILLEPECKGTIAFLSTELEKIVTKKNNLRMREFSYDKLSNN